MKITNVQLELELMRVQDNPYLVLRDTLHPDDPALIISVSPSEEQEVIDWYDRLVYQYGEG